MKTMSKRDYFLQGLNRGDYKHKGWVIKCFSVVHGEHGANHRDDDLHVATHDSSRPGDYFFHDKSGEVIWIEGSEEGEALLRFMDELILKPGDLANVVEATVTCYGNALVNAAAIIYAFGSKVTFLTGPLTVSGIEKKIEPRLIGNRDTPKGLHNLTIAEYKKFCDGITFLNGLTALCVPSASPKSLTIDKAILKRRDELFKEYKDRLDDPIVQAHIGAELIAMDKASFKGDPAERFYIKSKTFDIVRKRMHLFVGEESGFGKKGNFIKRSLSEGWDIEEMPSMANAMRAGSFNRGSRTALGGVEAKNNYRIFQNTVVAEDDCGTKLGLRITLTKDVAKYWLHFFVIEKDGTNVELVEENIAQYMNKPIVVRSPAYCKTAKQNLCGKCVGSKLATTPTAISTYASDLGSTFLQLLLASTHGKALRTHKFSYSSLLH